MCMWQVEIIKKVSFLLLIYFGWTFSSYSQDQTVKINIQIPAGVGIRTQASSENGTNRLFENALNYSMLSEDGSLIPLFWFKMQSLENSQFLLDFRKLDGASIKTLCYFLNNSTDELQNSTRVNEFPALFQFSHEGRLIRNILPKRTSLYSWVGIPNNPSMTTVIEYF